MGLLEDRWDEWKWRFDPNKTTEKESLKTAGGNQDQSSTFKFHKGMFWKKNLQDKNKNKGISFLDMGEGTGSQTGMDTKTGNTILPSDQDTKQSIKCKMPIKLSNHFILTKEEKVW